MTRDLILTSPAFQPGKPIPEEHTCDGEDVSPPLTWSGVPENASALVLIVDDPDAPGGTFTHWVVLNIPPDFNGRTLVAGVKLDEDSGIAEGSNDFGTVEYGGPCPPAGAPHNYLFRLYALDKRLEPGSGATRQQVTGAMDGHILAEANLSGTYQRPTDFTND